MPTRKPFRPMKPRLSQNDKLFVKLLSEGVKKSAAFKQAYPDHRTVKKYMDMIPGDEERSRQGERVTQLAKAKLQSNYIRNELIKYEERMDELADLGLDVAGDLMRNGKSEFVKADLAKEFVRHKVGSPTVKHQVQQEQTVTFTFGVPAIANETVRRRVEADMSDIPDAGRLIEG